MCRRSKKSPHLYISPHSSTLYQLLCSSALATRSPPTGNAATPDPCCPPPSPRTNEIFIAPTSTSSRTAAPYFSSAFLCNTPSTAATAPSTDTNRLRSPTRGSLRVAEAISAGAGAFSLLATFFISRA